ncbi:hypothetical protein CU102_16055 [Phyllobacterium brassicacearum]|uniref:PH domain-containing protein n=1 Tax=Phyllobacterium brassicacearum TaxID=314235 RepID=A0A2P7BNN0_9HYPH|nr:hypothetical protein [Phyllobacterium brassicacearum]PSH68071.1 hypothetical protein CU102_16055 [Phyllobacterium brassicacearum]TDQ28338.1 hypothetical protein DEV91_110180 [Phyllobacterium brassicacearum]
MDDYRPASWLEVGSRDQEITDFRPSIFKYVMMPLFTSGMMVLTVRTAFQYSPPPRNSVFNYYMSWPMLPLFAGLILLCLYQIAMYRRPVISLSPEGLLDGRIGTDIIPWPAIERIDARVTGRYKFINIVVRKEWKERLGPALLAYIRRGSKAPESRAVCIFPGLLDESPRDVASAIERYHRRFGKA